ncbi:MAG: phosphoribosylanthranilate isomerase [Halodesulfurarchaeum sp.]
MVRVKVCGFTDREPLEAAVVSGVDAVGAIVDVPVETPRELDPEHARALLETVPPFVSTVMVTMAGSPSRVLDLIELVQPDVVQSHGGLKPDGIEALRSRIPVVAGVDPNVENVEAYASAADALLVDSRGEGGVGGTGRTHDWSKTRTLRELDVPIVLAGGLTPENVPAAIETVDPYAVDVSSGVESEPGRKDPEKIRRFVAATGRGGEPR